MEATTSLTPASAQHLRLLAIFHYVFAGFALLGLGFIALHYTFMQRMMDFAATHPGSKPPPDGFWELFLWLYAVMALFCLLGMVLNLLVARSLQTRRRWWLCAVVSGLNCLQMPLGTVLGVFTLVVLNRADVRPSFGD